MERLGIDRLQEILERLEPDGEMYVSGLKGSSPSFIVSNLFKHLKKTILFIVPSREGEKAYRDTAFFLTHMEPGSKKDKDTALKDRVIYFPPIETLPYEDIQPHYEIVSRRMETLYRLSTESPLIVIATPRSIMQKTIDKGQLLSSARRLKRGDLIEMDGLIGSIVSLGYRDVEIVEERGEFAVRGCIIDIYTPLYKHPARIEFFGDEIESIRFFDPYTQRSIETIHDLLILPTTPDQDSRYSLVDYLPNDTLLCTKDRVISLDEAERFHNEIYDRFRKISEGGRGVKKPSELFLPIKEFKALSRSYRTIYLEYITAYQPDRNPTVISTKTNEDIRRDILNRREDLFEPLVRRIKGWKDSGISVNIVVRTNGQVERLGEIFEGYSVRTAYRKTFDAAQPSCPAILTGSLTEGFRSPDLGIVFITEEEIFGRRRELSPVHKRRAEGLITGISDIKEGDLIVHNYHGIGVYRGLKRLMIEDVESDYILIEYLGGDRLYLPVHKLSIVQRYIGGEGAQPQIDRLGGSTWEKKKRQAKKSAEKVARELIDIYATREALKGFSFSKGDGLFKEFEESFEYEETPDQRKAIEDVINDMESDRPMDRLVCGDVGYGKTEIALRASFKAVLDSKQVAFLVPTTFLAEQHYETFRYRLASYPVNVEVLSRFRSKREQKGVLNRLAKGEIDIIIGTHRLLQDDVRFKDLGLLIIDEEQRFGVIHKERLKKMKKLVDVLTLTATPIPRTLQMCLSGVRDISIIATPPEERLSIKTFISRFDREVIREAVLRELDRGGQVFFVNNRIRGIQGMAELIREIVPGVRVGVAHGRMKEERLEEVLSGFINREYDILVTTSIIESGLDIPSVNTIIINRANTFGLTQLYQLRGRVGRSHHKAYAYLLIPGDSLITEEARKRLKVIEELHELGSGFTIATCDLEIRGAGELLGTAQSGKVEMVGLAMYSRLIEHAVKELRGEEVVEEIEPEMKIHFPCYLPKEYIRSDRQRLFFYKRLASVSDINVIDVIREEMIDRFGEMPEEAMNLFDMMEIRALCKRIGVTEINLGKDRLTILFGHKGGGGHRYPALQPEDIVSFIEDNRDRVRFTPDQRLSIRLDKRSGSPFKQAKEILGSFLKDHLKS